jgi:hypothetical protein
MSKNVKGNGSGLRWLDMSRGTSAEHAGMSQDVAYEMDAISRIGGIRSSRKVGKLGTCKKFEKCQKMSSAVGDRGDEGCRDRNHLTPRFLIVNHKYTIKNISTRQGVMVGRNSQTVEENGITKKITRKLRWDLRSGSRKVINGNWSS